MIQHKRARLVARRLQGIWRGSHRYQLTLTSADGEVLGAAPSYRTLLEASSARPKWLKAMESVLEDEGYVVIRPADVSTLRARGVR